MIVYVSDRKCGRNEEVGFYPEEEYICMELPLRDQGMEGCSRFIYLVPTSNTSAYVMACFGDAFDSLLEAVSGDEDALDLACKTWPATMMAMARGIDDKYSEGALIRIQDYDVGDWVWCVATYVGNVDMAGEDSLGHPRVLEAFARVRDKADEILVEISTQKPNTFAHGLKQFGKGFLGAAATLFLIALGGE